MESLQLSCCPVRRIESASTYKPGSYEVRAILHCVPALTNTNHWIARVGVSEADRKRLLDAERGGVQPTTRVHTAGADEPQGQAQHHRYAQPTRSDVLTRCSLTCELEISRTNLTSNTQYLPLSL